MKKLLLLSLLLVGCSRPPTVVSSLNATPQGQIEALEYVGESYDSYVYAVEDKARNVTCWVADGTASFDAISISCLPNGSL